MAKNKNVGKPRNYTLESGVYRFGKSATYRKKAIYKFTKKTAKKAAVVPKARFVEKKVGGAKNGETRMVRVKKLANDYPTEERPAKGTSKNFFSGHARKLRASLTPGAIAIVLAGVHKGKRVVVLKQLGTGLLLITGPFKINGCPLRRINQRYLLATSTKIDVSAVKVPENINDKYFARIKAEKTAKKEGDIFDAKKEAYKPSEQRKKDQAAVDTQVMDALKKNVEGQVLKQYLRAPFALSKGQYPHSMAF
jgi:large subunit ribosomal protein L6e